MRRGSRHHVASEQVEATANLKAEDHANADVEHKEERHRSSFPTVSSKGWGKDPCFHHSMIRSITAEHTHIRFAWRTHIRVYELCVLTR